MSVTITVNYEKKNYAVTVTNGKASVNGVAQITAHYGDTVTLTAVVPFGQSASEYNYSWQCETGGVVIANSTSRVATFQMPATAVVIVCTVTRKTYGITATDCTTNVNAAAAGSRVEITDTPAPGYHLDTLTVTGNTSGNVVSTTAASGQPYAATFVMPSEPVTVVATYAKTVYNINTTDCTAKINNQTVTTATYGDTVTLVARTLATGEKITSWTGHDGNNNAISFEAGTQTSSTTTFTMPAADVTVQPLFDDIDYTITANNCSVTSPSGGTANYGQTVTMQATIPTGQPASEYDISWSSNPSVTINKSSTIVQQATFTMPASNIAVTANVTRKTYGITASYATAKISGTVAASAAMGQIVTIEANNRTSAGLRFVGWQVSSNIVDLGNATAQTTTFTMPSGAVTVTALYEYIINTTRCTAKVSGTTVANAPAGTNVTFTADTPASGTIFKRLEITYNGNTTTVTQSTYVLTMPAYEVTVVAIYSNVYNITAATAPTGGTATIYDGNQTNVISYAEAGDTVVVVPQAPANGMTFTGWTVVSNNVASSSTDPNDGTLTFTMPSSAVELQANYKYNITTTASGASGSGASSSVPYADAGDTVNLTASVPSGQSASEYTFLWTCTAGGVTTITGNTSQNATFTMPGNAVTFNCQVTRKTYLVTVNNGTGSLSGTNKGNSFNVQAGARVDLLPSTIQSYQHFTRWTVNSGGITVTVDNSTTGAAHFTMPSGAVTVTAVIDNTAYNVNVTDGKAYSNSGRTTQISTATYNQTVYLKMDTIADTVFHNWKEANNKVTFNPNANTDQASFSMIEGAVNISAIYGYVIEKHGVTVGGVEQSIPTVKVNGTAVTDAEPGKTVTLTRAEAPTGYEFSGWTVTGDGTHTVTLSPNATADTVTFTMPACKVIVQANYTEQTPVPSPYLLTTSDDLTQDGSNSLVAFYSDAACTQRIYTASAGDTVYFRPIITRDWYAGYKFTLQVESGTPPDWDDQTADPADSGPIAWRNWQMPNDSTASSRPHVGYGTSNDIDVWAFTMPACDVNVECTMNWWAVMKGSLGEYNSGFSYRNLTAQDPNHNIWLQQSFRVDIDTSQYEMGDFQVTAYTAEGTRTGVPYETWTYDDMTVEGTEQDEVIGEFDLRDTDGWTVNAGRNHWFLKIDLTNVAEADDPGDDDH